MLKLFTAIILEKNKKQSKKNNLFNFCVKIITFLPKPKRVKVCKIINFINLNNAKGIIDNVNWETESCHSRCNNPLYMLRTMH